jgi:hypothetical protein
MATRRRTPTYGAATRLARIVHELHGRRYGWSLGGGIELSGKAYRPKRIGTHGEEAGRP